MNTSVSVENFVKTIYKHQQSCTLDTRPGSIAKALDISNAAVTDMLNKLAGHKLISYEKYKEPVLTEEGYRIALNIVRKHRLWETFLYRVLNLSMNEIHREAELLEHQTTDFLADKLDAFLGRPDTDPHGDPIPTKNGTIFSDKEQLILTHAEQGQSYRITRLFSSDKEFFDFCEQNKIIIGKTLSVEGTYPKTQMIEVRIDDLKILMGKELSDIIYVKQIKV